MADASLAISMNILLLNYEYPPIGAGAATATYEIARELVKLGHQPVVLTSQFGELRGTEVSEDGVKVIRIGSMRSKAESCSIVEMSSFMALASIKIRSVVRREKIDSAIAFFSFPTGPVAWIGKCLTRVPYVVSLRGGDVPGTEPNLANIHRLLLPVRRAVLGGAIATIANSEGLRKLSLEADPKHAVGIIPNGVDTEFFCPIEKPKPRDVFRFFFVGRLNPQKNLHNVLEHLIAKVDSDAIEFHVVGDGPERESLHAKAKALKLEGKVHWHGRLGKEAIRDHARQAHCFVNYSTYEGMPNAVLEAMACGLPVIASRVAGNEEVVVDQETGFLVDIEMPESLAAIANRLVSEPALAQRLGLASRERVIKEYAWAAVAASYAEILEK